VSTFLPSGGNDPITASKLPEFKLSLDPRLPLLYLDRDELTSPRSPDVNVLVLLEGEGERSGLDTNSEFS